MTRELARRGAEVVGIDISGKLIAKSREAEKDTPHGVRYIQADVTTPGTVGVGEFDVVSCSFGLSDIDDLDGAIRSISRVLRNGGRFAFSILHPCSAGATTPPVPGRPRL